MKKVSLLASGAFLILTLTGCGVMKFAQYNGQRTAWPTGSSFAEATYAVPVFRGWPERPYDVIGYFEFNNAGTDWNDGDFKQAARLAKQKGGDAILIVPSGGGMEEKLTAMRNDLGVTGGETVAAVLKWK